MQASERKQVGRRKIVNEADLLAREGMWVLVLYCLKHGQPGFEDVSYGSSGIIVKAHGDQERYFDASSGIMREKKGKKSITVQVAGRPPKTTQQPNIIESEQQMKEWERKAKNLEEMTDRILMGDEPTKIWVPAKPDEKHLWEGLKKAKTGVQIRKIVKQSKNWLIWRVDFPGGGFQDWSWHGVPKALYDHADQFCKSKLDPRYPGRDKRRAADYWKMEYFARVLAGLSLPEPISPSYSVEILRKMKHTKQCFCWRCKSKIRPRFPKTLARHLLEMAEEEKILAELSENK